MQKGKIIDSTESKESDKLIDPVLWQWQSGSDPGLWAETDPSKWTWQDYSFNDCFIIEEAFYMKKEMAELQDYEVDFKKMLQVNKKWRDRIRRVRRHGKSRLMMEIPEPVALTKDQKTMNQAFGSIKQFLDFIIQRNSKADEVYRKLKDLNLDSQNHRFADIIEKVVLCIEKGAEIREKVIKTRSSFRIKSCLDEAKEIINFIRMNSKILGEFLKAILTVYTMETWICYWLNELLRSENWEEINVLTPFLVCLVYTFKLSEYIIQYEEPKGVMNSIFALVRKQKLYLYRGAALTKEHLELYNLKKIEYFSWNGITSTSREKNVADGFLQSSLEKAKSFNEAKIGVFFVIETDFASPEDCEGMIDTVKNSCTDYSHEREVILAPGTVFQLIKTRLIENNIHEISLRIKKNFEKTKENIPLLGVLHDQAISEEKAIIDGLPSQQSFSILELFKGNMKIQKLEITNSVIQEHLMKKIESFRRTMNVEKEDIKLKENMIVVNSLGLLAHYYSAENLNDILLSNKILFKEKKGKSHLEDYESEITTLYLREECLQKFKKNNQLKELSEKIASANKIANLDLALPEMGEEEEWTDFLGCIRESSSLQSLRLTIDKNYVMRREGLETLYKIIESSKTLNRLDLKLNFFSEGLYFLKEAFKSMVLIQNLSIDLKLRCSIWDKKLNYVASCFLSVSSLQHLSIDFTKCSEISDQGLNHLMSGILSLSSLKNLSLNFERCAQISDEGLNNLKRGLLSLSSLQYLSMNFLNCDKISDKGLNHLWNDLSQLSSLQELSLSFENCTQIPGEGFSLVKNGLFSLSSLHHLTLTFYKCDKISDEALNHLKSAFTSFSNLQHLSMNFSECRKISDERLNRLKEGLRALVSLQYLSLNFENCNKISDEGLNHLKNGLLLFSSLQSLSLNLAKCNRISDEGFNHLKNGLLLVSSLQHFSLNFSECSKISDEGLNHLASYLLSLSSLQHLSLNFENCNEISDEGLNHLKSALLRLSSLQYLSLNFGNCKKISDEGLNHLNSGLLILSSLQHLSLDLSKCDKISNEELSNLWGGIFSLSSLQHLSLNFNYCISEKGLQLKSGPLSLSSLRHLSLNFSWSISDKKLNHLMSGLLPLSSLQHLSLNFSGCYKISNEGLSHLWGDILSLSSLQYLSLDLCSKISNEGLNYLKNGLLSLSSLQHLSLNLSRCYGISDKGLNYLKSGLQALSSLQHLSLNLSECYKISDKGLNYLKSGLLSLSSLQYLSFSFLTDNFMERALRYDEFHGSSWTPECEWCKISDEGLNHLKSSLLSLPSLQHLSLNFSGRPKISNEGLNYLKSGLLALLSLQHLSLDFSRHHKISDEGLNHLKCGLLSLLSLQYLSLGFKYCREISDEGLDHLKSGFLSLSSLQNLSINFFECVKISDEGLDHLKCSLLSLLSLQYLSLNFSGCFKISDKGLNHLKCGLLSLLSLRHLTLNFYTLFKSKKISDEGFKQFCDQLNFITDVRIIN